jgi:hypothetical protein
MITLPVDQIKIQIMLQEAALMVEVVVAGWVAEADQSGPVLEGQVAVKEALQVLQVVEVHQEVGSVQSANSSSSQEHQQ